MQETLWYYAAIGITYICMLIMFDFVTKILSNSGKHTLSIFIFSTINTYVVASVRYTGLELWIYYLIGIFFILLEFKFISKASLRQIFMVSTTFSAHIVIIHLLIYVFVAEINSISLTDMENQHIFGLQVTVFTCATLSLTLTLLKKLMPTKNFTRISNAKIYSEMVTLLNCVIIGFVLYDSYVLTTFTSTNATAFWIILVTAIFALILKYFLLVYAIYFVNMVEYKRHADVAQDEFRQIIVEKEKMKIKANLDDFTKLFNRRFIDEVIESLFMEKKHGFGIVFIDINALKYVNDNFGHDCGDKYILSVVDCICHGLREDDVPARIGGDEFLVIIQSVNETQLNSIIQRIRARVNILGQTEEFPMSISVGGVCVDEDMIKKGVTCAMEMADLKMRENKENFYKVGDGICLK